MFRKMSNTLKIAPASEVAKNFGEWHDVALVEPVTVTRYGRASVMLISAEHYRHLMKSSTYQHDVSRFGSVPLYSPHQILLAYAQGKVEWEIAAAKLGFESYRQLVVALADAGLDLPGTDELTLANQAKGAVAFLQPFLREDSDA